MLSISPYLGIDSHFGTGALATCGARGKSPFVPRFVPLISPQSHQLRMMIGTLLKIDLQMPLFLEIFFPLETRRSTGDEELQIEAPRQLVVVVSKLPRRPAVTVVNLPFLHLQSSH
jgi:hypothetical protein